MTGGKTEKYTEIKSGQKFLPAMLLDRTFFSTLSEGVQEAFFHDAAQFHWEIYKRNFEKRSAKFLRLSKLHAKGAANAEGACDADLPARFLADFLGDGKPQAKAAVFAAMRFIHRKEA